MFVDRNDAGKKLSVELEKFKDEDPIVLAIPRGGIATVYETVNSSQIWYSIMFCKILFSLAAYFKTNIMISPQKGRMNFWTHNI